MLRCRHKPCSKYGQREQMRVVPLGAFCNDDCATAYAIAKRDSRKAKERREKVRRFRASERPRQIALTQTAFNQMIRLLDRDRGCISCDKPASWGGQWHAGHFLTTAAAPHLRFDARNCHKQCSECNNHHSGNLMGYRIVMLGRYGSWMGEFLSGSHENKKLTCEELIAMRKLYRAEIRRLESGLQPSRDWRAIPNQQQVVA